MSRRVKSKGKGTRTRTRSRTRTRTRTRSRSIKGGASKKSKKSKKSKNQRRKRSIKRRLYRGGGQGWRLGKESIGGLPVREKYSNCPGPNESDY